MAACLKGTRTVQFVKAEDKKTEVLQDNSDLNIHETGYNPNTGDCVFIGYSEKEDYKNRNQETIKGTNLYLWKMNLKKDKKIRKIAHIGLSEGIDYGKWVYIDDRGDIYFQKMGQYVFDGKKVKRPINSYL